MRVKLALLVILVSSGLTLKNPNVCKHVKRHKFTQMVCSGWEINLPNTYDWEKITFKNVTGFLDLSNLTLTNLRYLSITQSELDNVTLGQFPNLVFLTVWKNTKFPNVTQDFFERVTHVTWLSLVSNNNSIAPNALHLLQNLTWLHIQNQKFEHLTREFFKESAKLHELSLRNCHLQSVDVDAFETTLELEILSMNFNKIRHFESGTFRNLKKLKILELHHNRFAHFNLEQFRGLTSLEVLGLPSNFLRNVSVENLLGTFPNLKKMEVKKKDLFSGGNVTIIRQLRKEGIDIIGTPHDCHHSLAPCK